ncbi:MAG: tetratricopeptide repeat protein [Bacteroidales bacterium]|nr:tetratricopeptide repeat protein [Bacteroidales bacterium]
MASIIPGYEYDIFISYRQKDNKYDGWVTEFISHLKKEIEATFKEDISIYFDENPHDGLLEIHNVDKSLENKLKSVIFMPIISQTYCDPKSFAWQNEFVAFNKMASSEPIGRDVKLPSGNVCSRIIPIKIHDLDPADTELLETELGCRLRSIDFIFSSAGVNRPLKPDDNPDKNLNKTYYRDQINKVANAVKEIIYSLHPEQQKRIKKTYQTYGKKDISEVKPSIGYEKKAKPGRILTTSVFWVSLGILALIAFLILVPKLFLKTKSEISGSDLVKKAIAVLPVSNFTGNPELDFIASGIQRTLCSQLGQLSNLIVRPDLSTMQFKDTKEPPQQIAKKLSVNNIIQSSIIGSEENLQIEVSLIEAFPSEKVIWSSTFNQSWNNITSTYNEIIRRIMDGIKVRILPEDEEKISGRRNHHPEILKAYDRGLYFMNKRTAEDFEKGLKCFNEAIEIDPADPLPYLGLAIGYSTAGHTSPVAQDASNLAKGYALKALSLDSTLADAHAVLAMRYLYTEWDFPAAERSLKRAMELNPNIPSVHYTYGWYLALLNKIDDAASSMKKAIEIDPTDQVAQGYLSWLYLYFGRYEDALREGQKLLQLQSDSTLAYYLIGSAYSEMGMHFEAIEACKKSLAISPGYESGLAIAYANAGQKEKALEVVKEMEKNRDYWWYAWGLAEVYAKLGEKQKAIDCLEIAYKNHGDFMPWMKSDIYFKPLMNEPRFIELVNSLKLPV